MTVGGPIIDLGNLSKPATILIEKVCNAVGVLYEPTRLRRFAKAEADADKIRILSRIELTSLEERAIERFLHQEAKRQENIECITTEAIAQISADAKVEGLDEDWIANLFRHCDSVSDKEMQSLWAKLLAGEAGSPGTYSKRTVNFVSTIDKKDAALFTALSQFVWVSGDPKPLIYDLDNELYVSQGISFMTLKHLDAIGLISYESVSGYQSINQSRYMVFHYFGDTVLLDFKQEQRNTLGLGHALFTDIGKELFMICGAQRNEDFFQYALNRWRALSLEVQVLESAKEG